MTDENNHPLTKISIINNFSSKAKL